MKIFELFRPARHAKAGPGLYRTLVPQARRADFSLAYPALGLDDDRAAMMRLHAVLHAA